MTGIGDVIDGDDDFEIELPDFSGVQSYSALKGEFPARITEIEQTNNKDGAPALQITWTITEGEHEGREARDRWNLKLNKGSGFLKAKLEVLGLTAPLKRSDILGKEAILVLAPQKNDDQYHEVKRIKPLKKSSGLG